MPAPPAAAPPGVMADRWAIGLDIGSLGLKPQTTGAQNVDFGELELAARFRLRPELELGASFFGGGSKGDLSAAGFYADVRYRFLADRPFNVFATGSLGVAAVAGKNATDTEKAGRGSLRLGAGLEYRFAFGLALEAQLRLVAVAENKKVPSLGGAPLTVQYELERYGLGGGSLVIGAVYYF